MKPILGSILVFASCAATLGAAGSNGLGGAFQDLGMGTRPLGMGGAFVAIADDANATMENPAGMAFFDKKDRFATFTHSNLFGSGNLTRDFVSYTQADAGFGAFGLAWNRFSANLDPEQYSEDSYVYAGAKLLSLSDDKYPKLAVGWQAKYLRVDSSLSDAADGSTVGNGTATGYGLGLGVMIKLRPSLSVGVMAQDLYSTLSWATGTLEIIPTVGRVGAAYKLTQSSTLAAEVRGTQGGSGFTASSWHLGAESWLLDGKALLWNAVRNFGVRGGYYQLLDNDDGGRVTVGGTAKADMWQIDYTYDMGLSGTTLGGTHRFGLGVNF
jgi:hypothetical protein